MLSNSLLLASAPGACSTGALESTLDFFGDGNTLATWKLNNDVTDLSGSYNGTATAITYEAGTFNQRAIFNGSTSEVAVSNETGMKELNMWVSAHITTDNNALRQTAYNHLVRLAGNGNVYNGGWDITFTSSGQISFGYVMRNQESYTSNIFPGGRTSYYVQIGTTSAVTTGQVYHVVGHINNNVAKVWVNGNLEDSITTTGSLRYSDSDAEDHITMGVLHESTSTKSFWFDGTIDQLRVGKNRAISDQDVIDLGNECR